MIIVKTGKNYGGGEKIISYKWRVTDFDH